jgi:hypothetical protein
MSVALLILHAKRIGHISVSSVVCLSVLYFSTLSHKRQYFQKKRHWNVRVCFHFLQMLSETFLIRRRIQTYIIIVHRTPRSAPVFMSDFNETWIRLTSFRILLEHQISWNSVQWEPSSFMQMDRQTDRQADINIVVAFCSIVNASKNYVTISWHSIWRSS